MTTSEPGLRVAYVPGVILTKWRTIWAERFPRTPLTITEIAEPEARSILDAAAADFVFARLPIATEGVHVIRLYDEVTVAWASKDHPLALYDQLTLADLDGERVLTEVDPRTIDQVADAEAVLRVPMSVARAHNRRDFVLRPITDATPTTIALVWRVDHDSPLIEDFIGVVRGRTPNSTRGTSQRVHSSEAEKPKPPRPPKPRAGADASKRHRPPRPGGRRRG